MVNYAVFIGELIQEIGWFGAKQFRTVRVPARDARPMLTAAFECVIF